MSAPHSRQASPSNCPHACRVIASRHRASPGKHSSKHPLQASPVHEPVHVRGALQLAQPSKSKSLQRSSTSPEAQRVAPRGAQVSHALTQRPDAHVHVTGSPQRRQPPRAAQRSSSTADAHRVVPAAGQSSTHMVASGLGASGEPTSDASAASPPPSVVSSASSATDASSSTASGDHASAAAYPIRHPTPGGCGIRLARRRSPCKPRRSRDQRLGASIADAGALLRHSSGTSSRRREYGQRPVWSLRSTSSTYAIGSTPESRHVAVIV